MMTNLLIILLMVVCFIICIKLTFFIPFHDTCYTEMEKREIASQGSCCGCWGGDWETDYLSYSCMDCPYFVETIDGKGRKENCK